MRSGLAGYDAGMDEAMNIGHGHVVPRPDGAVARRGGPGICGECSAEAARRVMGVPAATERRSGYAPLVVPARDLKMLREALCAAQSAIAPARTALDAATRPQRMRRLQQLINEIDRHRPLGPDGKHGSLHTATCGCEQ